MKVIDIDIEKVTQFSDRDRDYILNSQKFKQLISTEFSYKSFRDIINVRKQYETDRVLLHNVITSQYEHLKPSSKTLEHITNLKEKNTFTIATAHQPNLFSGPLYVPFKILSTIRLCELLSQDHPDCNFVPTYIMGAEDHDFEEINHLYIYNKKVSWSTHHSGSVGQYPLDGIKAVHEEIADILGEKSKLKDFLSNTELYISNSDSYGEFNTKLIHDLFDNLGLVIINMDDHRLKEKLKPVIYNEILHNLSHDIVLESQDILKTLGYSAQTHVRKINFFYKKDALRSRIEKSGEDFHVVDTDISFTKDELQHEVDQFPERFSPNVITRPLYQELILPNLAYVGGGGEISYWMERKAQFSKAGIPFPMLIRRVSGMIITESLQSQSEKLNLEIEDLFIQLHDLIKKYLEISEAADYKLNAFKKEVELIYDSAETKILSIDKSLGKTLQAEKVKAIKSFEYLESKLKKQVKRQEENALNKITKISNKLFPSNGLQERHDSIIEYLSIYGTGLLEKIKDHCNPFDKTFKVFLMQPEDR